MRILDRSIYQRPSVYAHFPVIRLELGLGDLEHWPTAKLGPAFIDGLLAALPGLHERVGWDEIPAFQKQRAGFATQPTALLRYFDVAACGAPSCASRRCHCAALVS
ncbi:MAG: hypothetical protein JSS44_12400 [Proteobacteria bacterium]|nr:hypothetical protein [Pseudomonadota bacterium]